MRAGDFESFGALLRGHRLNAALTQEELSELTGLSVRTISGMETGRTARPYRRSVHLIADALALSQEGRQTLLRASRSGQRAAGTVRTGGDGPARGDGPAASTRPAQLPPDIAEFTGRDKQAAWLAGLLAAKEQDRPVRVAAVTGTGGLGKSALAVHVAHQLSGSFPDGQIFLELQGSTGQPVDPADALARLLRHLGMADAAIPAGLTERAAEFRTQMAGLSILLVLDDARDAAHVRPLLPGAGGSAVLITSRGWLADLEGGRVLALQALGGDDSLELFASICGPERVAAEPEATRAVLEACAGLPLAIRIAAARLVARPGWAIGALAGRLGDEVRRLEELRVGDLAVRASFEVSYAALARSPDRGDLSRAFRLLGLWPGADISLPAAAALLGVAGGPAARLLEGLVDMHMLEAPAADRYRFHDLIRVFAAECAERDEPAGSSSQAVRRVLLWYTGTAARALTCLELPPRSKRALVTAETGMRPLEFGDYDAAAQWTDAERANIVSAVMLAARSGLHESCARLADVVWQSFMRSPWDGWLGVLELGIASAAACEDQIAQAWLLNYLGIALMFRGSHEEAVAQFGEALPLCRAEGDRQCEATLTANLAIAYKELKRFDEAVASFERSADIDPALPHRGRLLMNLGMVYVEVGRLHEGVRSMEEGLELINSAGDHWGDSLGKSLLADAYRQLGRHEDAISSAEQALEISRRVHDDYQEAAAWYTLGEVLAASGEIGRARQCLHSALALADRLGVPEAEQIAASIAALGSG